MSEVIVDIRSVTKIFSHDNVRLIALDEANLEIRAGDFFCLKKKTQRGACSLQI